MDTSLLNDRQKAILAYIRQKIVDQGYPPSVREIGSALGIPSSSSVHGYLRQLEQLGFLQRDPAKPRAMTICQEKPDILLEDSLSLPLLSFHDLVNLGHHPEDFQLIIHDKPTYQCSKGFIAGNPLFLMDMPDDSMINRAIFSQDLLFVEPMSLEEIHDGSVVVMVYNQCLYVRTLFKGPDHFRFQAENDDCDVIAVSSSDFSMVGKVQGILKRP